MRLEQTKDGALLVSPSGQNQGNETKAVNLIIDDYNHSEATLFLAFGINPILGFTILFGSCEQMKTICNEVTKDEGVPNTKRGFLHPMYSMKQKEST